jgi:hypothetical protein
VNTRVLLIGVLSVLLSCTKDERRIAPETTAQEKRAVATIASPTGAGAAEPHLYATEDDVILSWLEPVAESKRFALRFARYRSGEWSPARTIVERDDLFVNWADFPSVVEDRKGTLFAHWLQKSAPNVYSYDVWMATSTDGGLTWGRPFVLNRDGKKTEHGFVTLAPLPDSGVAATWLDGRNMTEGGHEHEGGDMTIRYATVDARGSIQSDVELDERACECCNTGMTVTSSGPVIVYRDRSPEEIRDISFVRRTASGWTEPRSLHADGWKINGCPVNGPQVDSIGSRVAVSWFTAAQERQRAYVAFSDDAGARFGPPIVIDDGKPAGRVDVVMLDESSALVCWLEQTQAGAEIRARIVKPAGTVEPAMKIADSSAARAAGFPRIARSGRDVWFAWTDQSATTKRVRVARGTFGVQLALR